MYMKVWMCVLYEMVTLGHHYIIISMNNIKIQPLPFCLKRGPIVLFCNFEWRSICLVTLQAFRSQTFYNIPTMMLRWYDAYISANPIYRCKTFYHYLNGIITYSFCAGGDSLSIFFHQLLTFLPNFLQLLVHGIILCINIP